MESLFEQYGLKVLSTGFVIVDDFGIEKDSYGKIANVYHNGLMAFVEVTSTNTSESYNVNVVVNLYDENGILIASRCGNRERNIVTFHTFEVEFFRDSRWNDRAKYNNIALLAHKARVYLECNITPHGKP